ncbi:nucleolar protein 16, partial [Phenoliferia sp. Uapishka_3]
MANPRQRRKSRSGTAKVKLSKGSRKSKNKIVLKAPAVLIANWDKHKTIRQNYARLGLMATMNPRQAGGIEPVERTPYAVAASIPANGIYSDAEDSGDDSDEDEEMVASTSAPKPTAPAAGAPKKLAKGEGRIERDETGRIVRVVFGGEDGEEIVQDVVQRARGGGSDDEESSDEEEDEAKPWGEAMADWSGEGSDDEIEDEVVVTGPRSTGQGIPIGAKRRKVAAKTDIVRELEALAATQQKVIRFTSAIEADWLLALVDKYGDDITDMTRDRKLNPWQKTAGEIKRAIVKAGGFSKLKAKLAGLQA